MTAAEANLQIGDRFRYPPWKNIWEVIEITKRGLIADGPVCGGVTQRGHKHFIDQTAPIEVVYKRDNT